jgi:hypothetical protein
VTEENIRRAIPDPPGEIQDVGVADEARDPREFIADMRRKAAEWPYRADAKFLMFWAARFEESLDGLNAANKRIQELESCVSRAAEELERRTEW